MSCDLEKIFKIEDNVLKSVIDVSYFDGKSLGDEIVKALKKNAEKVVIIDGENDQHWTGHQVLTEVIKLASSFIGLGLAKGDAIGFYNDGKYLALNAIGFMASIVAGLTYVGCDSRSPYEELLHKCQLSNIKVLVTSQSILDVALAVREKLSQIKHVFILDKSCNNSNSSATAAFLFDLPASQENDCLPVTVNPDTDLAVITFSSGTSGIPKAVGCSHFSVLSYAVCGFEPFNFTSRPGDVVLILCPLIHGVDMKFFVTTLFYGNQIVLYPVHQPWLHYAEKYRATSVFTFPTMIHVFADDLNSYSIESVTDLIVSGSKLDPTSWHLFMTRYNLQQVRNCLGMTEAGLVALMPSDFSEMKISCSGAVVPGVHVKFAKRGTAELCGPNEIGEICVKSPMLCLGYLNNEQANREAFDDDGFFRSGDAGYFDNNGLIYVCDRYKEIFCFNDDKVSPTEIEEVLMMHTAVQEAAVFGKAHDIYGEVAKAFVVLNQGQTVTESELINFVGERLAAYKHLKGGVEILSSFPRTARGKIDRKTLKPKV